MRNVSTFAKIITLLVLLFTFSSSNSYASNLNDNQVLNPSAYKSYLESLVQQGDENAQDSLNKFNALSESQQHAFVEFLTSPEYVEAFQSLTKGDSEKTYNINGVDVPVKIETTNNNLSQNTYSTFAAATSTQTSASHSITLSIIGIEASTLTLTVNWEHNGSVATRPLAVAYSHVNNNPALIISEQSNNNPGYVSGGYYFGSGRWTVASTGALGALSGTIGIYIKGSNPNNRYFSETATLPSMSDIPWTKF